VEWINLAAFCTPLDPVKGRESVDYILVTVILSKDEFVKISDFSNGNLLVRQLTT
jgi:hypothetical protein